MQAAEAYKFKTLNASPSAAAAAAGSTTWSASATKSRTRPSLGADTFQPPSDVRPAVHRTASSSPGIQRRQQQTPSSSRSGNHSKESHPYNNTMGSSSSSSGVVTSTHSTPSRKPAPRQRSTTREYRNGGGAALGDFETDEMILRRMEEILFTYKSKVEDRLAAEGKELPKDIFDDFTEHWVVNSAPYRAKSVDSLDSSDRSDGHHHNSGQPPAQKGGRLQTPPSPKAQARGPSARKDPKEGHRVTTRIPVPTFYSRGGQLT